MAPPRRVSTRCGGTGRTALEPALLPVSVVMMSSQPRRIFTAAFYTGKSSVATLPARTFSRGSYYGENVVRVWWGKKSMTEVSRGNGGEVGKLEQAGMIKKWIRFFRGAVTKVGRMTVMLKASFEAL